jgi:prevent-host-death family protein
MTEHDRVGIRELRQHLTVYLRRVVAGEVLQVTDRGRPVALLTPLPERGSVLERLVAEGRVVPARGSLNDLEPPPRAAEPRPTSQALDEDRSEP